MARVLFDSSVWISFFTYEDVRHEEAEALVRGQFERQNTILLPDFIYAEILNVSYRIEPNAQYLTGLAQRLRTLHPFVRLILGGEDFWFRYLSRNMSRFKIKTSDAIVCCYADFLQVDRFDTFDSQLARVFSRARHQ